MKHVYKIAFFTISLLLLYSCAQMVNPSGGQTDTTPPLPVKCVPANKSTNIKPSNIYLEFNEYIDLKDVNGQLIVSPTLKYQPDIKHKKKQIFVTLTDTLKENTTYTFNFGSSIRDITENNITEGYSYVFSTGAYLDSFTVSGIVKDARTNELKKNISICLYENTSDSAVVKQKPNYFTKTKPDGSYLLNNIKEGTYKLAAINDVNNNQLYDIDEEIAFYDTLLSIAKKENKVNLSMFKGVPDKLKIKKATATSPQHISIVFNKYADSLTVEAASVGILDTTYLIWNSNHDSLSIFLADTSLKDSLKLFFKSVNFKDTATIRLPKKRSVKDDSRNTIYTTIQFTDITKQDVLKKINISCTYPITTIDTSKIILEAGTKNKIPISLSFNKTYNQKAFQLNSKDWKVDSIYTITLLPGAIKSTSISNTDTIKSTFAVVGKDYYGIILLSFPRPLIAAESSYILEIATVTGKVIYKSVFTPTTKYTIENVLPGKYTMRLLKDENKNKRWDSGNYFKHKQPEKIIIFPKEIVVRSNWDLELEWDLKE